MNEDDIINIIPEGTKRIGVTTSGSVDEIDLPGYTEEERKVIGGLKFIWFQNVEESI